MGISGNVVNSVNQMWCHWNLSNNVIICNRFILDKETALWDGLKNKFDKIDNFQCSQLLSSKIRKLPFNWSIAMKMLSNLIGDLTIQIVRQFFWWYSTVEHLHQWALLLVGSWYSKDHFDTKTSFWPKMQIALCRSDPSIC